MTGKSILDNLNAATKGGAPAAPSARFRTKDIAITNIYRNSLNGYSLRNIEELAEQIVVAGRLLHNLVVVYDPQTNPEEGEAPREYRLVDGERRWLALTMLAEQGATEYMTATCQVLPQASKAEEQIMLVLANAQRDKTLADRVFEYTTLKAALEELRAGGGTLYGRDLTKGRLRDHMAEFLQVATGTLANLEKISSNLQPPLRHLMETGELNYRAALAAADLPAEAQLELAGMAEGGQQVTAKTAKELREAEAREKVRRFYEGQACHLKGGTGCDNAEALASFYRDGAMPGCAGCCAICDKVLECHKACEAARNAAEAAPDEEAGELAAAAPEAVQGTTAPTQQEEPHPDVVQTICFDCANFEGCPERNDKTMACNAFRHNLEAATPPAGPVTVTPAPVAMRTDEQLFELLKIDGAAALFDGGMINRQELERAGSLLSAVWARWIQTGQWGGMEAIK